MSDKPRRRFLKQSASLVTGLAASSCASLETTPAAGTAALDRSTLEALGAIVLPRTTLRDEGVHRVIDGFTSWLSKFEPVAELDHPYLWTDEIAYGPPDPAPLWNAQLEALELEAQKRHGESYSALGRDEQEAILENQLPRDLEPELPYAGEARHVAIGLLAYFYGTREANDLGYGAAIEKQTCRGLESGADEPTSLGG